MLKKAELNIFPQGFSLFLFQIVHYVINPCEEGECEDRREPTKDLFLAWVIC
jgi:hypothetical protein